MGGKSVFHLVFDLTGKEGVSCILIGGFAVNFYNYSRQTNDVDFLITKEAYERIAPHLLRLGYSQHLRENFAQLENKALTLKNLDFIFVDQDTFNEIKRCGKKVKIAKLEFIAPSLNHLIALKLHAINQNPKNRLTVDLIDIIKLAELNKIDVKGGDFKKLCLKYGSRGIYNKILDGAK